MKKETVDISIEPIRITRDSLLSKKSGNFTKVYNESLFLQISYFVLDYDF